MHVVVFGATTGEAISTTACGPARFVLVEPRFDDRDVAAILGGILDVNAKLAEINVEVRTIRVLLENGDEEEEEEAGTDDR